MTKGKMGLEFCNLVKEKDPFMPFLLQSSDETMAEEAKKLGIGFMHKYSKALSHELNQYIIDHFGFGDFVFRDPDTMEEIARASDLQSLQNQILLIPDETLRLHTGRNDFSKWLNARAIFQIAELFKPVGNEDFDTLDQLRNYIYNSISDFRIAKGRGVIAKFDRNKFSEYLLFSRIGEESSGGKARGLAFINSIIEKYHLFKKYR